MWAHTVGTKSRKLQQRGHEERSQGSSNSGLLDFAKSWCGIIKAMFKLHQTFLDFFYSYDAGDDIGGDDDDVVGRDGKGD